MILVNSFSRRAIRPFGNMNKQWKMTNDRVSAKQPPERTGSPPYRQRRAIAEITEKAAKQLDGDYHCNDRLSPCSYGDSCFWSAINVYSRWKWNKHEHKSNTQNSVKQCKAISSQCELALLLYLYMRRQIQRTYKDHWAMREIIADTALNWLSAIRFCFDMLFFSDCFFGEFFNKNNSWNSWLNYSHTHTHAHGQGHHRMSQQHHICFYWGLMSTNAPERPRKVHNSFHIADGRRWQGIY